MKEKNARIFVASLKNTSNKLTYYGDANIENISLLKLIYKYAQFSTVQVNLQSLDKMVSILQRTDPDICMETQASVGYIDGNSFSAVSTSEFSNTAPTISGVTFTVVDEGYYITIDSLLENYIDPEKTAASLLTIESLPSNGTLYIDNSPVSAGQVVDATLKNTIISYVRNSNATYSTSFNFSVYDSDSQIPLKSNIASATINNIEIVIENEAATVGDTNLYMDNRNSRVFSVSDFTTSAIPQFTDPEGDGLDAVRIDNISNTNTGEYLYYGVAVVVGQVISASDLNNGAFTYTSPDTNSIKTDVIEVSVRDTGSMIWVS